MLNKHYSNFKANLHSFSLQETSLNFATLSMIFHEMASEVKWPTQKFQKFQSLYGGTNNHKHSPDV